MHRISTLVTSELILHLYLYVVKDKTNHKPNSQ